MALPNPELNILNNEDEEVPDEVVQDTQVQQEIPDDTESEEEIHALLLELVKKAEEEDRDLRFPLLRICKRNDLYFNNIQTIFYDEVAKDYRDVKSVMEQLQDNYSGADIKVINVYKAYAESIIAALSVQPPNTQFMPDDAEDTEDLETAKAYSKIEELIRKHNHASLMLIKALTLLYNCGVIFGYNYYKTDPAYGTFRTPKTVNKIPKQLAELRCSQCGQILDSGIPVEQASQLTDLNCPTCGYHAPPEIILRVQFEDEVAEWDETPKGRSGFDIFSPTHVKVSLHARNQSDCGYLVLRLETHQAKVKATYDIESIEDTGSDTELYERWARTPIEYAGTIQVDLTTLRYVWLRPWWFRNLDIEKARVLESKFPNGVKVTVNGNQVLEFENANLDDEWTISFDPKANFIHAEPPGNAVIPIQDAKNDVFNLGIQSIEYGIPETYVHPKTLNLAKYGEAKSAPGMMTAALPPSPDKSIGDGFYQSKPATLSNEYTNFDRSLDQTGQFVSAALPSLWGGNQKPGETTASEYTQSRSNALQRLQPTWEMISVFWTQLMFKCVKNYATNLREDEKFTKQENGTFVNVWINKSSLQGKVGHVEPELSGSLPLSWSQKKDFIMQLANLQDDRIGSILFHPNNAELIKRVTGMQDMYIPGEYDRNKQYQEYYELSVAAPISETEPSIPVDIDVDDHMVHMQVMKNILVSNMGINLYKTNPQGYQNCVIHYRQHQLAIQAMTQAPSGNSGIGQPPDSATNSNQG